MMDTAKVIQVIETTLTRKGKGIESDPIRVTQYWSTDGKLLAYRVDDWELSKAGKRLND